MSSRPGVIVSSQPELRLHHFPGACSSVSVCALEMAGLSYDLSLVNLAKGEQASDNYLAVSPLGKVPLLEIDGEPLSENAAILTFLDALRPNSGILPPPNGPRDRAEAIGGIAFCSGTLHPQVRGLLNPARLTTGDGEPVRERSRELAIKSFAYAEKRIAARGWWLGTASIVDVYLDWAFSIAAKTDFETLAYPQLTALGAQLAELPSYTAMQAIDTRARSTLGL